jgi:hypothetical protein
MIIYYTLGLFTAQQSAFTTEMVMLYDKLTTWTLLLADAVPQIH